MQHVFYSFLHVLQPNALNMKGVQQVFWFGILYLGSTSKFVFS